MSWTCHFCKRDFMDREEPTIVRFRHETYSGEEFFIYQKACRSCADHYSAVVEKLEDGQEIDLGRQVWKEGRLCDSPPAPAVKPEQMTLDQAGQLDLFKEEA